MSWDGNGEPVRVGVKFLCQTCYEWKHWRNAFQQPWKSTLRLYDICMDCESYGLDQ